MKRAVALAGVAFFAAACGSSHRAVAPGCVRVYFDRDASRAAENAVTKRLREDERVLRMVFVDKAQALREMRRKHPELFARLPANPLPDALRVLTRDAPSARSLRRSVGTWRGVALAKAGFAFGRPVTARRCL